MKETKLTDIHAIIYREIKHSFNAIMLNVGILSFDDLTPLAYEIDRCMGSLIEV